MSRPWLQRAQLVCVCQLSAIVYAATPHLEKVEVGEQALVDGNASTLAYWACEPVKSVQPPQTDDAWVKNEIDRFVNV